MPPEQPVDPERPDDPIARLIRLAGPRESAPADRAARVRDAVHAHWCYAVLRERRRAALLRTAQIAAGLLLALGTVHWLRERIQVGGAPAASILKVHGRVLAGGSLIDATGGSLAAGAEIATGSDGRVALRLRGGPSLRLDTDTEVRLISGGVVEMRRGALYVDTGTSLAEGPSATPGPETIRILTGFGRVRDVGTQFEVRLAAGALQVSVRGGVATLERDDRSYAAPAGTRLRVDARGAVETATVTPQGADWDWVLTVAPPFDLEGHTLRDYLDWLSRETGWRVTYSDPSIGSNAATIVLHGSTSGLRPDETPAVVLPTCGLQHRLAGETLVIERPAGERGPS